MFSFPTLTGIISYKNYHDTKAFDPTYRSDFVSGHQVRRSRATWVPKLWRATGRAFTNTDRDNLQTLEENVGYGADSFAWYNSREKAAYYVCFAKGCVPLDFSLEPKNPTLWQVNFIFRQTDNIVLTTGDYGFGEYGAGIYGQ